MIARARAPPLGQDRGEDHQDQTVPHSEARLPDLSRGDEELLAKESVLGEELPLGAREIREEATTRAAGVAWCGCECFPDNPPTSTANAAEDFTDVLPQRQEHDCHEALNPAPMEA